MELHVKKQLTDWLPVLLGGSGRGRWALREQSKRSEVYSEGWENQSGNYNLGCNLLLILLAVFSRNSTRATGK